MSTNKMIDMIAKMCIDYYNHMEKYTGKQLADNILDIIDDYKEANGYYDAVVKK